MVDRGAFGVQAPARPVSDSIEKGALEHELHATSASGIEYRKPDCTCQYPKSGE
jgi:hypothetical protein